MSKKVFEQPETMTLVIPAFTIVLGAVVTGVSAPVFSNIEFINGYSSVIAEGENGGSYAQSMSALLGVIAGGLLIIISGVLGLIGHFAAVRPLTFANLGLGFVSGIVLLASGAIALNIDGQMDNDMLVPNLNFEDPESPASPRGNVPWPEDTSGDQVFLDFGNAVFDECCADVRSIGQVSLPDCFEGNDACNPRKDKRLAVVLDQLDVEDVVGIDAEVLCTCIVDKPEYDAMRAKIEDIGYCKTLESAWIIDPRSLTIPLPGHEDLVSVKRALEAQQQFKGTEVVNTKRAPLVGPFDRTIANNTDPEGEELENYKPSNPNGYFGCGLGFYKGMYWLSMEYVRQEFGIVPYIALAGGALTSLLMVVFLYVGYLEIAESDDSYQKQGSQQDFYSGGQMPMQQQPQPSMVAQNTKPGYVPQNAAVAPSKEPNF